MGAAQVQEAADEERSGLLALRCLPWYFPDSRPHLRYVCLISRSRWIVLWRQRSRTRLWHVAASSSSESTSVHRVDDSRQNLVLRLSNLLAPVACIIHSLLLTNTVLKIPLELMRAFPLSYSVFKAKILSNWVKAANSIKLNKKLPARKASVRSSV